MSFIYHGCPETMIGTVLYPLNVLRTTHPELHRREMAKYADNPKRQALPSTVLPLLDCLWNDVLHCSPIHPHRLYHAWRSVRTDPVPELEFYRIPINRVAGHPLALMRGRDLECIDSSTFEEIPEVSPETIEWYRRLASQGRFGAHFVGVPHVLVKGAIDIAGVEVMRWSDPLPEGSSR